MRHDGGRVDTVTDNHGNDIEYVYNDRNQVTSVTAPGSRTWSVTYDSVWRPDTVSLPNGLSTEYDYSSTTGLLEKITHLDGANVLASYEYLMDHMGNIETLTQEDGFAWTYGYDNRYRLTSATLSDGTRTRWAEIYAYDDGDNLTQRTRPWSDTFNDGTLDGWTVQYGSWSADNAVLEESSAGWLLRNQAEDDSQLYFSYVCTDTSDNNYTAKVSLRSVNASPYNTLFLYIQPNKISFQELVGGAWTQLAANGGATTEGQWYDVAVKSDGANVTVWRRPRGSNDAWTLVLSTSSATVTTSDKMKVSISNPGTFAFDDFAVLTADGDPVETVAFTANDANELTQMTGPEGTTTFTYDDWGRMTSKSRSSYTADYTYGPMSMLWGVESDFPGEGDATYLYGGDGKRRNRVTATDETWYNWAGWSVINEEDDADGTGNLTRWYMGRNGAHADGANPSTGTWRYYTHDHLSSTRNVYDSSKNRLASYDYTPYGEVYASAEFATANHTFTGHAWDAASGMYFAPFRHYAPSLGRWTTPDPLGMVDGTNMYGYVGGNPMKYSDFLGLRLCFDSPGLSWDSDIDGSAGEFFRKSFSSAADGFIPVFNPFSGNYVEEGYTDPSFRLSRMLGIVSFNAALGAGLGKVFQSVATAGGSLAKPGPFHTFVGSKLLPGEIASFTGPNAQIFTDGFLLALGGSALIEFGMEGYGTYTDNHCAF